MQKLKPRPRPLDAMDDAEFIQTPMVWPRWPLLPMKHRHREAFRSDWLGFMIAEVTPPFKVYVGAYLSNDMPDTIEDFTKGKPMEEYSSVEALLKDWRID